MKQKILTFLLIVLSAVFMYCPESSFAQEKSSSAKIERELALAVSDYRIAVLRNFLESYNSPLAENADDFVRYADMYELDWRFVAAISGLESTFGHQIPNNSYNAWGWGVYGGRVTRFASWEEGIATISQGLRENYINKWGASNIYEIGRIYAASPTWAQRVTYFMNRISDYSIDNTQTALPLTI